MTYVCVLSQTFSIIYWLEIARFLCPYQRGFVQGTTCTSAGITVCNYVTQSQYYSELRKLRK